MSVLIPVISELSSSFLTPVTMSLLVCLSSGREKGCRTGTSLAQEKTSSTQMTCIALLVGQGFVKIFRVILREIVKPVHSF